MFNMIKMDLYRMFHTKALYVIWIVLAAAVLFTTSMSREDLQYIQEESQENESTGDAAAEGENQEAEMINMGMQVTITTQPGEKVTLFDQVFANLQAKFVALFFLIFTVLYSSADIGSGYIKNIGGQVRDRSSLIISRAAVLLVYTVLSMALYLIFQAVCQRICFGYLIWGEAAQFWKYVGMQTVLHYALVLITMALAVILKYNVISMTLAICLTMNVLVIFYSAIDKVIHSLGAEDFHIIEHTVTGKIALLSMNGGSKEYLLALATAAVFGAAATALTCIVFRRRDV